MKYREEIVSFEELCEMKKGIHETFTYEPILNSSDVLIKKYNSREGLALVVYRDMMNKEENHVLYKCFVPFSALELSRYINK